MAIVRDQAASSSPCRCSYDVFLSFRGEDTRKTFTDHLYTALVQAGFRTFRDNDEIERGEKLKPELDKAIQQSRTCIIVFSKDYASSTWCLDELVMILECRRTFGYVVLPIFYDVDPSDIRKQKNSIGKAFAGYEEKFVKEADDQRKQEWMVKIKGWREALTQVADLTGMVLQNQADGHESKFIQEIVKVIDGKLNRTILSVGRYLVGINARVQNINMWLKDESSNANILVICGMGGIGKTTIAKFVYNSNFQKFEFSSFLATVREKSEQPDGLVQLQRQLLSNIVKGKKENICNVDEGIIKIEDAICCKRILVVLDDVDELKHLDALLGRRTREFYPGSKIIITTRKRWLLTDHEVHKVHLVENLYYGESLELLSWHAFRQAHPMGGYDVQSKRLVHHCAGLPLALEVLGSALSGRNVDFWEKTLEKLEAIPDSHILEKLKVSYESLQDDHDKDLFLHIACFFVGKAKYDTIKILDNCNFFTTVGIQNLIDRCLITIEELSNDLMMHQLLQEMGRDIIRQESPKEPGKRSRLWHHKDSFNVLKEKTGTETIEGLFLDMHMFKKDKPDRSTFNFNNTKKRSNEKLRDESMVPEQRSFKRRYLSFFSWQSVVTVSRLPDEVILKIDAFQRMDKLRLLQLNYVQLTGCYDHFPENLRLLCWHGFPLKSIPINLPLKNLVGLDMCYSKLQQVWKGPKFLGSLKILNLSYSEGLVRTPNFLGLPNLEKLMLKGCVSLVEVCESIENLEVLSLLDLENCINLRKLPRNIHALRSLETLIITGCSNLGEFPMEMRDMESLKVLHANGIATTALLTTVGEIKSWHSHFWPFMSKPRTNPKVLWASLPRSLVKLYLSDNNLSDDSFPRDLSNLSSLTHLDLSKNPIRILPDCVNNLSALQVLNLKLCTRLQSVLCLPSTIDTLWVEDCSSLEKIMSLSGFALYNLLKDNCSRLVEIEGYYKLEPIVSVDTEIIKYLGFLDVESLGNLRVHLQDGYSYYQGSRRIQGLHEFGIFSTFVPGGEIPSWFDDSKILGSSISFIIPPTISIQCLNVCAVYRYSGKDEIWRPHPSFTKIHNKTKDLTWIYCPVFFGMPERNELAWLSQWKFGNQLETEDEVTVTIDLGDAFQVKECGVKLVYDKEEKNGEENEEEENEEEQKEVIDGDLSAFQLSTGAYFLFHDRFHTAPGEDEWTAPGWFRNIFGDLVELTEIK